MQKIAVLDAQTCFNLAPCEHFEAELLDFTLEYFLDSCDTIICFWHKDYSGAVRVHGPQSDSSRFLQCSYVE